MVGCEYEGGVGSSKSDDDADAETSIDEQRSQSERRK